jgi:YesN/AraC family two-component response regulator
MARILIIDDEEQIRSLLRATLEHEDYEIDEARNGREGLQRYRAAPADLVITDILMPEQNGLEMIKDLRRDFPQVKIIAIFGSREFHEEVQHLGVQRAFQKPFHPLEILEAVHTLVPSLDYAATG